jgi:hypothetical protein
MNTSPSTSTQNSNTGSYGTSGSTNQNTGTSGSTTNGGSGSVRALW